MPLALCREREHANFLRHWNGDSVLLIGFCQEARQDYSSKTTNSIPFAKAVFTHPFNHFAYFEPITSSVKLSPVEGGFLAFIWDGNQSELLLKIE